MRTQTAPTRDSSKDPFAERLSHVDVHATNAGTRADSHKPVLSAGPASPSRATFLRSFVHAWDGIVYAFLTQRNARVHLAAAIGATALGIVLRLSAVEFALIALAIMAVMAAEMINTVVEALVDLVTSDYHPLARVAKDVAAGAVLLCAIFSVVIGLLVFGPHLWPLAVRFVHML